MKNTKTTKATGAFRRRQSAKLEKNRTEEATQTIEHLANQDPHADREAKKYEKPVPSREYILDCLQKEGRPLTYDAFLRLWGLNNPDAAEQQEGLRRRLKAMIRDGQLRRLSRGRYWPIDPGSEPRSDFRPSKRHPSSEKWGTPKRMPAEALDSQTLMALESNTTWKRLTGRFVKSHPLSAVIPYGKEWTGEILIPEAYENGAKEGQIVISEVMDLSLRDSTSLPVGRIIQILGDENTPGIQIDAAISAYGLPSEWPAAVAHSVSKLSTEVPSAAKRERLDLRDLPFVTIDGEDARDFDDAIYCEVRPRGGFQLWVAIADVSHYVKAGSALDLEAQQRGNSVYFPGRVIPMLPEVLSNELCSLKPQVDRLALVVEMHLTAQGRIRDFHFHEAVIRSAARLTYTKVAAILEGAHHLIEDVEGVLPLLHSLADLFVVLNQSRGLRGAIDFETTETKIIFDEAGKIARIEPVKRNIAHRIVEECMLCANVCAATFLKRHEVPTLYRVHGGPPPDKLSDLREFLRALGLQLGTDLRPTPQDYAALLRQTEKRPDAAIIQTMLLRSLSQAVYSPDNIGHFGLAYDCYCHFTSPIRRYPDLWVHRQIRMVLRQQWTSAADEVQIAAMEGQLAALGAHCSMTERRADDSTRDAIRWLKCQYLAMHIGECYKGVVSGVTHFGFFVELSDLYVDGLVHVTSLQDDYYRFDVATQSLIGERSKRRFQLGQSLQIIVGRVDVDHRRIDFAWVPDENPSPGKKQGPRAEAQSRPKKARRRKK